MARGGYTRDQGDPEKERLTLDGAAQNWAAPQARDHFPAHSPERIAAMKAQGHGMRNLNDEAETWRAPKASDPEKAGPNMRGSKAMELADALIADVLDWRSPAVNDPGIDPARLRTKEGAPWTPGERAYDMETGRMAQTGLTQQAMNWAGPAAQNHKGSSEGSSEGSIIRQDGKSRADILSYQAEQFFHPPSSPDHPTIAAGSMSSTDSPNSNQPSVRRKLNPIFVEALMRWPTGLSGFERQETALIRWRLLMHSCLSALASDCSQPRQGSLL